MSKELTPDQQAEIELLGHLKDWADKSAEKCHKYIMSQDGGMSEAAMGLMADQIRKDAWDFFMQELAKIKGGYAYSGACSYQLCFPLKAGGELRFSQIDSDVAEGEPYGIDLYDGSLPGCITGFSQSTGPLDPEKQALRAKIFELMDTIKQLEKEMDP